MDKNVKKSSQQRGALEPSWFDKLSSSKKDLICIGILYVILLVLFNKIVFNDMIFSDSGDTASSQSWVKAAEHLEETEHIEPLWFPYVFSGMPGFGSLSYTPRDVNYLQQIIHLPGKLLFLNSKMSWVVLHFLLAGVFMFLLVRQLKFSHIPALIAALTLMMNPYAIGLAETGHGSKLIALSYIPLIFLLTHSLIERRNMLSFGLLAAAIGTQLLSNHVQMVFYSMLVIGGYVLYSVILDLKKEPMAAVKGTGLFILALAVGFAISSYVYLSVREYAQFSIRGGGEAGVQGGLSYDYATNWSFHPFEMMNYLIPSFFGFSSSYLTEYQGQQTVMPLYWGWMPFTDSTMYIGIVPLILGILALIYKRNRMTRFLGLFLIFVFLVAFGKHLSFLYDLMFNYFPFFNKLRVPAMILHLVPFLFGLLAAYGADFILSIHDRESKTDPVKLRAIFRYILYGLAGLFIVGLVAKSGIYSYLSGFMFSKEGEVQQYGQQVLTVLKEKRFEVLWNDYAKFTVFSAAFFVVMMMYLNKKLSHGMFFIALLLITVIDLSIWDVKYISPKPNTAIDERFQPDQNVQMLKQDTTLYRVFPVGGLFQDNSYMYHTIPSIGGYSPAKLRIYQELLDSCVFKGNINVASMLNAKYILSQQRTQDGNAVVVPQMNPGYLPRAWFAESFVVSDSKQNTFARLNSPDWDPRKTAILEKNPSVTPQVSDSTFVDLTQSGYGAHTITMKTYSSSTSLLVLSEIYYPAGWKAYVDGTETEIYKTNYVLRSIVVPQGNHTVEFKFDPESYHLGSMITNVSWGLTAVLVVIGLMQVPAVRRKLGRHAPAETT